MKKSTIKNGIILVTEAALATVVSELVFTGCGKVYKKIKKARQDEKTKKSVKANINHDMKSLLQPYISQGIIDAMIETRKEALVLFKETMKNEYDFLESIKYDSDASNLVSYQWIFSQEYIDAIDENSKDHEANKELTRTIAEYYALKEKYINCESCEDIKVKKPKTTDKCDVYEEHDENDLDGLDITITPPEDENTEEKDKEDDDSSSGDENNDNETETYITEEDAGEEN